MKALSLIGTLFLVLTANSVCAGVIQPHTVAPASIKTFEYKGQKATVSADVPQEVYGEYRLDIASGRAAVASRTITLNPDGTGKAHNYGNKEAPKPFEWGVLVNDGVTEITVPSITHKWWVEAPLNKETWSEHAYVVVLKYDSGEYGSIFVFEQEGVMIIPGPAGMGIWKY